MKRTLITLAAVIAMIASVIAFVDHNNHAKTTKATTHRKVDVVTTNSILADMVENVTKGRANVHSLVRRGVDSHEYEPKPEDIAKTAKADLVFYNGLNLETGGNGCFKKLVETSHKQFGKDVFAASAGVIAEHLSSNQNEDDPHAWLNLANGAQYVRTITKHLKQVDPKNATFYQKNADAYINKLMKLRRTAQSKFKSIPEKRRLLVTSEGAFKYFAKAYHVKPAYIWEINTESQGTPAQMKSVLSKIKGTGVKHLFLESSVSPKSMNKVADETGIPIYSKIFTDSLAKKGHPGGTYYSMMKWNLDKIYAGLA